jgi:hypothetical protein
MGFSGHQWRSWSCIFALLAYQRFLYKTKTNNIIASIRRKEKYSSKKLIIDNNWLKPKKKI